MKRKRGCSTSDNSKSRLRFAQKSFFAQTRGQITVFIIVGIVILFTSAGVLFVSKNVVKEKINADGTPIIASVPVEFEPVNSFTEQCIAQVAEKGLRALGEQGGYISAEILGDYSQVSPTDSKGIDLGGAKVPFWYHNAQPNSASQVEFELGKPALTQEEDPELSIESQLRRYVQERLDECLKEYEEFSAQGFEVDLGGEDSQPQADVAITDTGVNVLVEMPIDVTSASGATKEIEQFFVQLPVPFKKYYNTASEITAMQQEFSVLERQGLDLIEVFSGIDPNKLPPTLELDFSLVPKAVWSKQVVEKDIQGLLTSYVPLLQFSGSSDIYAYQYPASELDGLYQQTYNNMILPLSVSGVEVQADYFGWKPYFATNDEGGKIAAQHQEIHQQFLHFGQQQYTTTYDLSYPVLITLHDSKAFNGEGYTFVFALESNIRNNEPATSEQVSQPFISSFSGSMACDENKRNTELIRTLVVDGATKKPLDAVNIGFTIPNQDDCAIGTTNSQGVLEESYPAVYGGVAYFTKPGYSPTYYDIDTYQFKEKQGVIGYAIAQLPAHERVVELFREVEVPVSGVVQGWQKCVTPLHCEETNYLIAQDIECSLGEERCFSNGGFSAFKGKLVAEYRANQSKSRIHRLYAQNGVRELAEDESLTITLRRVEGLNERVRMSSYETGVTITGKDGGNQETVRLVPGKYEVQMTLFRENPLIIPQDTRCSVFDIITYETQECVKIDEVVVTQQLESTIVWESPATYFEVSSQELYTADEIEFTTVAPELGALPEVFSAQGKVFNTLVIEDLTLMSRTQEITSTPEMRERLAPRFMES